MLLSLMGLTTPAWCAVTVIADVGPTQPLAPLLEVFRERAAARDRPLARRSIADPAALLPIRSPGLAPGIEQARAISLPLTRPLFLIGADAASLHWLTDHHQQIVDSGAVGMLVQAESIDDLTAVAALADGLSILPASASDIAATLKIAHYPVLITRNRIEP